VETGISATIVAEALDRVLSSELFAHAERQRRFLEYVVRQTLADAGTRLNQHAIAIEVFDRDETFDPSVDSVVRVEAGRLRARLREYYEEHEPTPHVRIDIPKRGYSVNFTVRTDADRSEIQRKQNSNLVVAVLRFDNISGDATEDSFADGLTEDLITDLASVHGLEVVSRNSSFAVSRQCTDLKQISQKLGASYLVEGSVRRVNSRVRINAQLIDGARDVHVWADRYDYDYDDILALQDDVVRRIATALKLRIPTPGNSVTSISLNHITRDLVYGARALEQQPGRDNHLSAMALYESAIKHDPTYAIAHARASGNAVFQWILRYSRDRDATLGRALELAERATELKPRLAISYASLSFARMWTGDSKGAREAGATALSIDASDVRALQVMALVCAWSREHEESERYLNRMQRIEPGTPHNFMRGVQSFMIHDYQSALAALEPASLKWPDFIPIWLYLAASYSLSGRSEDASNAIRKLRTVNPDFDVDDRFYSNFAYDADRERFLGAVSAAGL